MDRKKMLPVGIENFEEMRRRDFYYVDKTELIADLMNNCGKVNLFTRPRRFGKTLNMSMLKSFFEIGGDKSIFDGLAISHETALCEEYMGRYPVVFLSLKGVDGLTFEDAYGHLKEIIRKEARRHQYLLASDRLSERDRRPFEQLFDYECDKELMSNALLTMSELLEKHCGQKVILLIDEYDVPLDKAYQYGYYDRMIALIRSFLGAALKTNDSLYFAVLTGCMRVSKESIFTGLNNLKVRSISDVRFDESFGFTDQEVGDMLAYYGLEMFHEKAREWYDGYLFGGQEVYCPWDVINYCDDLRDDPMAEPRPYWLNSSGNDIVRRLIERASDGTTQAEVEDLIDGGTITKQINEQLTHNEIDDSIENVWSLLYMSGYLTVTERPFEGLYVLRIPNKEVRQIFKQQVLAWFRDKARAEAGRLTALYEAFETGDTETIADTLNELLLDTISFYDAYESFYHGFLLALLSVCANWSVASNLESGRGRSDIIVENRKQKIGFVVEVKEVKDESELDAACDAALKQIEEKDYTARLRIYKPKAIWSYGIAFCRKECRVVVSQRELSR